MEMTVINGPRLNAPSGTTKRLVVFLHGYGSNGQDLISLAPYFAQIDPDADFISPDAPEKNPFNPMGYQWFPIPFIDGSSQDEMAKGLVYAQSELKAFVEKELKDRGLTQKDLVFIGFSQGTMMSLHYGLRADVSPAAIIGFSGRLLFPDTLKNDLRSQPPVALIHGAADDVVPVQDSKDAHQLLSELGVPSELHISPNTPHSIAEDGLIFALDFYQKLDR